MLDQVQRICLFVFAKFHDLCMLSYKCSLSCAEATLSQPYFRNLGKVERYRIQQITEIEFEFEFERWRIRRIWAKVMSKGVLEYRLKILGVLTGIAISSMSRGAFFSTWTNWLSLLIVHFICICITCFTYAVQVSPLAST